MDLVRQFAVGMLVDGGQLMQHFPGQRRHLVRVLESEPSVTECPRSAQGCIVRDLSTLSPLLQLSPVHGTTFYAGQGASQDGDPLPRVRMGAEDSPGAIVSWISAAGPK